MRTGAQKAFGLWICFWVCVERALTHTHTQNECNYRNIVSFRLEHAAGCFCLRNYSAVPADAAAVAAAALTCRNCPIILSQAASQPANMACQIFALEVCGSVGAIIQTMHRSGGGSDSAQNGRCSVLWGGMRACADFGMENVHTDPPSLCTRTQSYVLLDFRPHRPASHRLKSSE